MTEVVTGTDVLAMVIELLDIITAGVVCLVDDGNVAFSVDEFNCDELIIVTEVMVRTCDVLDKRLVGKINVVLLEDTVNEDVLIITELFTCGVEGKSVVTFDEDVVT